MSTKNEKLENLVREYASEYIIRESGATSLITITRAILSEDRKKCMVLFTCMPIEKENAGLGFLKRHRGEMREYIMSRVNSNIPFLDVSIDAGEKNRQLIDTLLYEGSKKE